MKNILTTLVTILFLIIISWGVYLEFLPEKATNVNFLYNTGFGLLFAFAGLVGLFGGFKIGFKSAVGKSLTFLGLAFTSYAIGLFIWTYYNIVLAVEIPSPSLGDIFYLVLYLPLATMGLWFLISIYTLVISKRYLLEALAIFIGSCILIFGLAIQPQLSREVPLFNNLVNAGYPFTDAVLLALSIIALRAAGGKISQGILVLVIGLLIQVIGDIFYSTRVAQELYWNGDIADKTYTIAAFVISLGMINILDKFLPLAANNQKV